MMSQLVINEIDCDTPGIDDKEFVELRSDTPNFPLDGYVVVFFNGSASGGDTSYLALDLDGYETDINGLLLIGSTTVNPFPQYVIAPNLIQNGADAVAIYQADDLDFPDGTLAYVDASLVDVLLYQTNDSDGLGLVAIFWKALIGLFLAMGGILSIVIPIAIICAIIYILTIIF